MNSQGMVSTGRVPSSDDDSDSYFAAYRVNLLEEDSSVSSVQSCYDVSKLEAYLYYSGIRGACRRGPKLIFRTSKDVFKPPSGLWQECRVMQLQPVYEHHKLGKDNLWATVRSKVRCDHQSAVICGIDTSFKVVKLLDQRNIQHSSVDLVCFSWIEDKEEKEADEGSEHEGEVDEEGEADNLKVDHAADEKDEGVEDFDIKTWIPWVPYRTVTTPVTIWVGVLPDTLTGEVAFHSSNDILHLLKKHGIFDVDVAYRESVARSFSGPELFAPVSDWDPLKAIIDPVTTALGLPIAGLNTLNSHGTLGFYFHVGKDLYGVTARHILFPEDEGNNSYTYVGKSESFS